MTELQKVEEQEYGKTSKLAFYERIDEFSLQAS